MTDDLLLDTHIALWLENGDERLRNSTLALIERCWLGGGRILLSAISVWEIAQLIDRGRIALVRPLGAWLERFADRPGIEILALGYREAARAYQLSAFPYRDPADRLLIASAIEQSCPLVTYDTRIVRFAESHGGQYGFSAAS